MIMAQAAQTLLKKLIADRLAAADLPAGLGALSDRLREEYGSAVVAILAYGSCLRARTLEDGIADLYVIVSDYQTAHHNATARLANRLLPPNVYFVTARTDTATLRAKAATVSLAQFRKRCSSQTENPYFWARFAQPSALVWTRDEAIRAAIIDGLGDAVTAMLIKAAPLAYDDADAKMLWHTALANTYRTEWRPEPEGRIDELIAADEAYYADTAKAVFGVELSQLSDHATGMRQARRAWAKRRFTGKLLTLARLVKAAFTFQGGADYLAWKIARHSGEQITLSPWQRRHPVLAGLYLLPRLWARGVLR